MATIRAEIAVATDAASVWDVVRDVGAVHRRLAPGFVTDVRMGDGERTVTFANGFVVRERIVDIDDATRRLAYSAVGGRAEHHNASIEVRETGPGRCVLVWITDVLPHAAAAPIGAMVAEAAEVIRRTLEGD